MNSSALSFEKFLSYLTTLQRDYARLSEILVRKREAVLFYDLEALDDIMKDEQAYVLLSRGFNANVEAFREALGLRGVTLSEVIESMPAEWKPRFRAIAVPLRDTIAEVRKRNEECQTLIEDKLSQIGKKLQGLGAVETKAYRQTGGAPKKPGSGSPGSLNKSI